MLWLVPCGRCRHPCAHCQAWFGGTKGGELDCVGTGWAPDCNVLACSAGTALIPVAVQMCRGCSSQACCVPLVPLHMLCFVVRCRHAALDSLLDSECCVSQLPATVP